jgi:hypothetical protein
MNEGGRVLSPPELRLQAIAADQPPTTRTIKEATNIPEQQPVITMG